MIRVGTIINYLGTDYRVKRVTPLALCLGCNYEQQVWVEKSWFMTVGLQATIGRSPAHLYL